MSRIIAALVVFSLVAGILLSQPPGGDGGKKKGKFPGKEKGPPRFELGRVLPPGLREQLGLTREQQKALDEIEKELREKLNKLLTEEQKKVIKGFRPGILSRDAGQVSACHRRVLG
jgi:hypothetical protein